MCLIVDPMDFLLLARGRQPLGKVCCWNSRTNRPEWRAYEDYLTTSFLVPLTEPQAQGIVDDSGYMYSIWTVR